MEFNPSDPKLDKEKIPVIKRTYENLERIVSLTVLDDIYISDGKIRAPEAKIYEEFEKLQNREIFVNLPEFKLYLCEKKDNKFYILKEYGIGIGKEETPTWVPGMKKQEFFISSKIYAPVWLPSMEFVMNTGLIYETLAKNPMGTKKLELSTSRYVTPYAIHGTRDFNQITWYIGRMVSHGCVRVPGIEDLYKRIIVGNKVTILYKPLTITIKPGELDYEVLRDVYNKTPELTKNVTKDVKIPWDYLLNNSLVVHLEN